MGLLEDLQNEVAKKRDDEARQRAESATQETYYHEQLHGVMLRANEYLSKIVDNLKIVAPPTHPTYPLDPLLEGGISLEQGDYHSTCDNTQYPRQIDIFCSCTLMQPHQFYLDSKEAVIKHTELLDQFGFDYHRKNVLDDQHYMCSATFILKGPMRVHMQLLADPAERCVYVKMRNLEHRAFTQYKFPPEKIDRRLLERLAKVLLRQQSKLVEVAVSDSTRRQLRAQLDIEKKRSEQELAAAHAELEAEKMAQEKARLSNRIKAAAKDNIGSVLRQLSKL